MMKALLKHKDCNLQMARWCIFSSKTLSILNTRFLTIIVIPLALLHSCGNVTQPIQADSDLFGVYNQVVGSKTYNYLILRRDSTYTAQQTLPTGSDALFHYCGNWTIEDNVLILYRGTDIETYLHVEEKEGIASETLTINIAQELLTAFPRLSFSINDDTTDLEIHGNKIDVIKKKYWDIASPKVVSRSYEYVPLSLNLRARNIYATLDYIFKNKELSVSLKSDFKPDLKPDSILCKYRKEDGFLYSFEEAYDFQKNRLKKETNND